MVPSLVAERKGVIRIRRIANVIAPTSVPALSVGVDVIARVSRWSLVYQQGEAKRDGLRTNIETEVDGSPSTLLLYDYLAEWDRGA